MAKKLQAAFFPSINNLLDYLNCETDYYGEYSGEEYRRNPSGTGIYSDVKGTVTATEKQIGGDYDKYNDGMFFDRWERDGKVYTSYGVREDGYDNGPFISATDTNTSFYMYKNKAYNGFYVTVFDDGRFYITNYTNGLCDGKGLWYEDGYLFFIPLDREGRVGRAFSKIYIGKQFDFPFTSLVAPRRSYNNNMVCRDYSDCTIAGQIEYGQFNGYGIVRFDNDNQYVGQFLDGKFTGIGFQQIGTHRVFGKFHDSRATGNAMFYYDDNTVSFGNFNQLKIDGTNFDYYPKTNRIYLQCKRNGQLMGNKYRIDLSTFEVTELDANKNVLNTYEYGY